MFSLLQAIYEDLDNDEPRLVYADWLDEHGDPYADLIRIQCRLSEIFPACGEEFAELCREEHLWINEHRQQLLSKCPERLGDPARRFANRRAVHLERGFPQSMHISWDGVPDEMEQLLAAYPTITDLEIASSDWVSRYIDNAELLLGYAPRLQGFITSLPAGNTSHLIPFLCTDDWQQLRRLKLHVTPADLVRLAEAKVMDRVEELSLVIETPDPVALMDLPVLRTVRKLEVQAHDETLVSLVNSMRFPELNDLTLRLRETGAEQMQIIASLAYDEGWENLRRLSLPGMEAYGDGFLQLIASPLMKNLNWLDLTGNSLPGDFFWRLTEQAELGALQSLRFLEFTPYGGYVDHLRGFLVLQSTAHLIVGVSGTSIPSFLRVGLVGDATAGVSQEARRLGASLVAEGLGHRIQPPVSRWR